MMVNRHYSTLVDSTLYMIVFTHKKMDIIVALKPLVERRFLPLLAFT